LIAAAYYWNKTHYSPKMSKMVRVEQDKYNYSSKAENASIKMQLLALQNHFDSNYSNVWKTKTNAKRIDEKQISLSVTVQPAQIISSVESTAAITKQHLSQQTISRSLQVTRDSSVQENSSTHTQATSSAALGDQTNTYVHQACQLFPKSVDIIRSALQSDRDAVRRYEKLEQLKLNSTMKWGLMKNKIPLFNVKKRRVMESYRLPINIALKYKASNEVIKLLIDADPTTLLLPDGNDDYHSLIIAIKTKPNDLSMIELLLVSNPKCIMMTDRRQNYPLHIACSKGSNLNVIRFLYNQYPVSAIKKNFNGETGLDIAQRNAVICDEDVIDFLQQPHQTI